MPGPAQRLGHLGDAHRRADRGRPAAELPFEHPAAAGTVGSGRSGRARGGAGRAGRRAAARGAGRRTRAPGGRRRRRCGAAASPPRAPGPAGP
ncbi:hypothetical protein GEV43_46345 [Actinomadura sp. J1-007]|nr:hypothetical protein [Actinomadura sp. J1-007]